MKKYTALIFSAIAAACFALSGSAAPVLDTAESSYDASVLDETTDTLQSELLFFQDFDSLETGAVTGKQIASMFGLGAKLVEFGDIDGIFDRAGTDLPSGCTFEICEEADGNKYLKVTGNVYNAFGVYYGDSVTTRAVMSYNYKHTSADKTYKGLSTFYTTAEGVRSPDCWNTGNAVTDTKSAWTVNKASVSDAVCASKLLGLGFAKGDAAGEICIDDLAVWSMSEKRESFYNSTVQASKTVTFADSTGVTASSLPDPVKGYVWGNLYGAQKGTHSVNLNNYTASAAGYEFKGWSMTDGGRKIKDVNYSAFKIIGDITLYPIWEKTGIVSRFEDFEKFEVGQVLTSADLEFIKLNQFAAAGFTATVIKDEETGSKALSIESDNIYAGFLINNRVGAGNVGNEYFSFNYRFKTADSGSRLTIYSGTDHTGSNHKGQITERSTEWKNYILGTSTSAKVCGCYFDNGTEGKGNFNIIIDDVAYWFVPSEYTADDKTVGVTFQNSSNGLAVGAQLPDVASKKIWEEKDKEENYINLTEIVPTEYSPIYELAGWSRTDGGALLKECELLRYRIIKGQTLYAVWRYTEPSLEEGNGVRADEIKGIRYTSALTSIQFKNASEFGYIAALAKTIGDDELTFALDSSKYVSAYAYKNGDETTKLYTEKGEGAVFSAVVTGVDTESKEQLSTKIAVRPYVVINANKYYGRTSIKSFADAAAEYKADAEAYGALSDDEKALIDKIYENTKA